MLAEENKEISAKYFAASKLLLKELTFEMNDDD